MRIVMDFDGIYTDPSDEGDACSQYFSDKILSLALKEINLDTPEKVASWFGELRVRQASQPFLYGWRSEGRVSAFTFEDPFIRNIGLADFLDHLVSKGDLKAKTLLKHLSKNENISSFGELSEWSFHQLTLKKKIDQGAKQWVEQAIRDGHEIFIVSNSAKEKIEDFLNQNGFDLSLRPKVLGGAKKFSLGRTPNAFIFAKNEEVGELKVDTDRPFYEKALMDIKPDAVIGDVFCLDLSLPIRLKREGKLPFLGGIFYRHREYTPSKMVELLTGRGTLVPEVTLIREWGQLKLGKPAQSLPL